MAVISKDTTGVQRWFLVAMREQFPEFAFWINFHPIDGCHRLHFVKKEKVGTDGFVSHSFPIYFEEEDWVALAVTKIALVY
jgi:hypothetical protein